MSDRPGIDPETAAAVMRYAQQPLEPDRATDLARRLARFRAAVAHLDTLITPQTEPADLRLPGER